MKSDFPLFVFSMMMLIFFTCFEYFGFLVDASNLAQMLAPQYGLNEDNLREYLTSLLERGRGRRVIVYGSPWAIMTGVLAVKIIVDLRRARRELRRREKGGGKKEGKRREKREKGDSHQIQGE